MVHAPFQYRKKEATDFLSHLPGDEDWQGVLVSPFVEEGKKHEFISF
jgi:hypothetical protein